MFYDKKQECLSKRAKHKLQSERLIDVVKRVYESVPTYRAKMDAIGLQPTDIKSIDDIVKLPFTTKQDLRDNYPFGMFARGPEDIIRVHASSGTTGKLTVVGYTKKDIDLWAECCARGLAAVGAEKKSLLHVAYGYGLFTGGLGLHYGGELLGLTVVPVSAGNTQRQIQLMVDFKADGICCTPSYAVFLGDELKKANYSTKDLNLKWGLFGAEPWTEEMRREIEEKLGLKAYDIYGLSEIAGPGVASECEFQTGSHIWDDYFYPEIVDLDTLKPLPIGERGELVFTTLTKEGMPLIRYRTRDITALDDSPCPCGRTGVRLNRIKGRSDDMLIIRGVNVFPSQIESALISSDERISSHYHITVDRINNLDVIEIAIELKEDAIFDEIKSIEGLVSKVKADVASAIGVTADIKLLSCGSIKRSEGKAQRVTDKRQK
ncbi:MAG: phenylacetate--CoA ligase [Christensenellaceae bacterium]|jgi:phenylacetate-CoA ligase|nr:phenylacetate--CoA ligase [Christensenellaceae bacterium]